MPLVFRVRTAPAVPVEVDSVRLETVREQSVDEIRRTEVQFGNRRVPLGEFFDVSGSAADGVIVWEGDCSKVKLIGHKLSEGHIRVVGNAGMHLGAEMTGGEIVVEGNASDWVGAEMHGGRIHVKGDAGHLVGAVYRGGARGMTGGEILVEGRAGQEIGHGMRRGLIAIGGGCGDLAGVAMLAGSIFVFGEPGIRLGAGMKRGTIALFDAAHAPPVLPTFRQACTYQPVFLRLALMRLRKLGFPVPQNSLEGTYRRYSGDLLESGKGEILARIDS